MNIQNLFKNKKEKKAMLLNGLLNVKSDDKLFESMTTLQNEISVSFNTKVVAIASINDDDLSANFAKAFADTFSRNGSSCLIIDANLYDQKLRALLGEVNKSSDDAEVEFKGNSDKDRQFITVDDKVDALCLDNEIYPSKIYKSGLIQKTIKENKDKYEHFILIVPSLKNHKEISLLGDVIESIVLVAQKNVTIKEHIFNAIQYLAANELPLAKTVVVK